jgi:hypothetical protein
MKKHVELWAMNVFDEWRLFRDFDTRKSIVDISKNEGSIKDLVDMLSSLFCKLQKKMVAYILQLDTILYDFLNVFIIGGFFFPSCVFLAFVLSFKVLSLRFRFYVFIYSLWFLLPSYLCFYKLCYVMFFFFFFVIRFKVFA